jgi:hypothetical protein
LRTADAQTRGARRIKRRQVGVEPDLEKMKAARHALEDDGQPFSPAMGPLKS